MNEQQPGPKTEFIAGFTPLAGLNSLVAELPQGKAVTLNLTKPLPAGQLHDLILGADARPDQADLTLGIRQEPKVGPTAVTIFTG